MAGRDPEPHRAPRADVAAAVGCQKRIDLADELRRDLDDADRDFYDAVCFTHLDDDHAKGSADFFWFRHAACYQGESRIKINELWVPAAAVTEEGSEDDARVIRQEARPRLKEGKGIKVFSRPDRLKDLLESWGLTVQDRASCIVDAGRGNPEPGRGRPVDDEIDR